jgi:hypothetical protein
VLPFQSTAQKDSLGYWFPTDINEIDSVQAQIDKQIIWNNFFPYMKYPTSLILDTIESTLYIPRVNSLAECGNNFLQLGFFKYKSLKIKESTAIELLSKECVSLRMDHYCLYKDLNSQSKNMADNCLQEQFSMQRIERKLYKKVQNKIRFEKEGPLKNYKGEFEKIEGVFIVAHFFNVPKEVCIIPNASRFAKKMPTPQYEI